VIELAEHGIERALEGNPGLRLGLNVQDGEITHPAVAQALSTASPALAGAAAPGHAVGSGN
jgi:alanine dehydrogenase